MSPNVRMSRTPLFHLQFYLELPFDAGVSQGAFNVIEFAHPPLEDWADLDLQAFLGMPELPKPAVRPCVVMRFRRAMNPVASPFATVLTAYPEELSAIIPDESELESPTTSVTVVKAERIVPSRIGEFDESWLREQFHVVLSKLNNQLLALGAAAGNHRIHPVHEVELPSVILGWQQDLRDLGDPDRPPRLFLLFLHPGQERVSTDHDATIINRAMGISDHLGHGPFSRAMEFLYAAQRSAETGRAAHAVLEAGTAVELLVDGVVRAIGKANVWTDERLENVLVKTPFRSRYVDHFARALGLSVDESKLRPDPVDAWLDGGYELRNQVAHSGYQPTDAEAVDALSQASSLLQFAAERAARDPALGISFSDSASLVPHPELDERSIASEGPPAEDRLAREAFGEGVAAFNHGDTEKAAEHFAEASRHGSPGGAFNVALTRWNSGDEEGARESLQLAVDRGHAGATAYLGMLLLAEGRQAEAEELFRRVAPGAHSRGWPLATFFLATILESRNEREEAADLYRDAAVVGDFALGPDAAFRRGVLLKELGDPAAIDAWTFAVELGSARAAVALADRFTSERDPDHAITMLRRAVKIEGDPIDDGVDIGYGIRMPVGDGSLPSVQEEIAMGMILAANGLGELERGEEALKLLDEVLTMHENPTSPILRLAVAKALVSKSACLGRLGRQTELLEVSDAVVARFGIAEEAAVRSEIAAALLNKGTALLELGRLEEALAVYDDVLMRFGNAVEGDVHDQLNQGFLIRAVILRELGLFEESVAACDDLIARVAASGGASGRDLVTRALTTKAIALSALGRWQDAVKSYGAIDRRLASATEPETPDLIAWTLFHKAVALGALGRKEEALGVYDDVVARTGESDRPQVRQHVAASLVHKGILLAELGRLYDAIATDDNAIARFDNDPEPGVREQVARALVNKAVALSTLGSCDEAIAIDDDVVARFGDVESEVARALVNKSAALAESGRHEDALAACESIAARFSTASDVKIREAVADALLNKGEIARELGRGDDAAAAYTEAVSRFHDAPGAVFRERVAQARRALTALQPPP
jgi:tetratricopeptide (TPR) repeat protein